MRICKNNTVLKLFSGTKIILRHIRNGIELPPLLKDDHYDFNYQSPMAIERVEKLQAVFIF
jgi:hypothetical protein